MKNCAAPAVNTKYLSRRAMNIACVGAKQRGGQIDKAVDIADS
jgi:hypothetical protein